MEDHSPPMPNKNMPAINAQTSTLWTVASVCLLTGNAFGQSSHGQGTINRQRVRLDDTTIAPATNGWLNDSQTPRFWAWKLYDPATFPCDYPIDNPTNCPLYDDQGNIIPAVTDT